MKVAELGGGELDYYVALAEGRTDATFERGHCFIAETDGRQDWRGFYRPSSSWGIAGPIVDRENISVRPRFFTVSSSRDLRIWEAAVVRHSHGVTYEESESTQLGLNALEAAMRCFVASKYGDTVPPLATEQEEK